jgi:tetratricopeptide (TPR) repeat protein
MRRTFVSALLVCAVFTVSCVSQSRAEEYYALGEAYFNLKRYDEAESWFSKSKFHEKTKMASLYNLGRIAYERGFYDEALVYFRGILAKDGENTVALRAAAYSCVKVGNTEQALEYYRQISLIIPESAEESYNYGLLLAALDKNEEAEQALKKHGPPEGRALLLLARVQRTLKKPEAVDSYNVYLATISDPAVRFEYAQILAEHQFYAKALVELEAALNGGFNDVEKIEVMLGQPFVGDEKKNELRGKIKS